MKTGQSYYVLKPNEIKKASVSEVLIELEVASNQNTIFESNLPMSVDIEIIQ